MALEKLENMIRLVLKDLNKKISFASKSVYTSKRLRVYAPLQAEVKNVINISHKALPEHEEFFVSLYKQIDEKGSSFDLYDGRNALEHILEILEIEKTSESKVKEMKIFEGAEEKMKQAGLSFRKDDYPSTFHNLNTTLELVLKDKLGIPTTITKINTSNIIDILVKHKVEPYLYLAEAKKQVLTIDNKIKHQGYSPSKIDCINGIKVMEELVSKLRDKEIKLTEEIRNKIYQGL